MKLKRNFTMAGSKIAAVAWSGTRRGFMMTGSRIEAGARRGTQRINRTTRLIRTKLTRRVFTMAGTKNAAFASQYRDLLAQLGELELHASEESAQAGHLVDGQARGHHERHVARVVPGQERGVGHQPQPDARLLSRGKRQHPRTWIGS